MSLQRKSFLSAASAAFLVAVALAPPASQATPNARSLLYSVGGLQRFCSVAQQITASTTMWSINIGHSSLDDFTFSSAAPYEGPNLSAYNGKVDIGYDAGDLPLTTQQLISYRELTQTGWEYPIVVSCKMKTAEAINFHFGAGSAGTQLTCREVNQRTVADVYASLTSVEQRTLRWPQSEIVFLPDLYAGSGPSWLYPLPYLPQVATIGAQTGKLRLRGYSITVARTDPSTAAGPDKKGSYYCHLPSAEYIRALITGQMQPILEEPLAE